MASDFNSKILIINDNPDSLDLISFVIQQAGYDVLTAKDGQLGLESATSKLPDLIISDIIMPGLNGFELCRMIRQDSRLRLTPLILTSAIQKDTESAVAGLEAGADGYIEVPFEPMRLVAKVARLLERTHLEEKLRLMESAVASIREGIIITDPSQKDNPTIFANDAFENLTGYSLDEILGKNCRFLQGVETDQETVSFVRECIKNQASCSTEILNYKRDGTPFWNELLISPIKDQSGRVIHFVGVQRDITERKQAEEKLLQSQKQLAEAQQLAKLGSWDWDIVNNKVSWSDEVYCIFGLRPQEFEISFDYFTERIHPEDRERVMKGVQETLAAGKVCDYDCRITFPDETIKIIQVRGKVVTYEGGNPIRALGTVQDITERKFAEEALRQSQKMESVGRLAGGIAHDFNNMLTAINGYSDLILRKLEEDDPLRPQVKEIKKAGERSASLTHQLLAFSRQQILQPQLLNLDKVVSEISQMLQRLIGEDIQLTIVSNLKSSLIKADPGQLTQVIINLAVNARDAMPAGGKLVIETANVFLEENSIAGGISSKAGNYVKLSVSDTGIGMEAKIQERIFEPFYTTKEVGKGTGLGMATVYGIIKQSGGYISVNSKVGVGTTFTIYLPLIQKEENNEIEKGQVGLHLGTETILLVEDEIMVRKLNQQMLEECGYKVIEASDGLEALSVIGKLNSKIDLLLTDVVMPKMGGRELAEKLNETHPEIKTLFMSGYTNDAIIRNGISTSSADFIQKPFTLDTLALKVREVLDGEKN